MTSHPQTRQVAPESQTESPAVAQRYEIAIGGAYPRIISGAIAEVTFQRWRQLPDILLRGDLQTGFCWQWPDRRRTEVTVKPVANEPALSAEEACNARYDATPISLSLEPR